VRLGVGSTGQDGEADPAPTLRKEREAQGTRTGPVLAIAAVIGVLGARFFGVIRKYSVNIFFNDQWDYLTPLFRHHASIAELFLRQHGPHREGIGLVADKFLFPLTHWNALTDSFLIGSSIFAAMLLALLLKCKLYGTLSYSDVAIPVTFLTLAQYETLVVTPNPAYGGLPLLLMMLYCLALLGQNRLLRYSLVLALNFLLIYTGFGFFMGVVTVCVLLLECYGSWRPMRSAPFAQALAGLTVAAASLASFFIRYKFFAAADCLQISHRDLQGYLGFMARMFSAFVVPRSLSVSSGTTVLGAVILLVAVGVLGLHLIHLLKHGRSDTHLAGAVLLSYCLLFSANAAIGRSCLGLEAASSPRYSTLLIPGFLAIYFFLLSKSWGGRQNLLLILWVVLLLPATVHKPWRDMRWYSDSKRAWADCYVRAENIQYCDQSTNFVLNPHPERTGLKQKLDYLKEHRLNLFHEPTGSGTQP